jgi:hypothetical protein
MAEEKKAVDVVAHVTDSGSEEAAAPSSIIKETPQKKWTSYLWDTFDKSPEERRFLFKLDAAILTFASLGKPSLSRNARSVAHAAQIGYFIKYLDQTNINNAFVSGM